MSALPIKKTPPIKKLPKLQYAVVHLAKDQNIKFSLTEDGKGGHNLWSIQDAKHKYKGKVIAIGAKAQSVQIQDQGTKKEYTFTVDDLRGMWITQKIAPLTQDGDFAKTLGVLQKKYDLLTDKIIAEMEHDQAMADIFGDDYYLDMDAYDDYYGAYDDYDAQQNALVAPAMYDRYVPSYRSGYFVGSAQSTTATDYSMFLPLMVIVAVSFCLVCLVLSVVSAAGGFMFGRMMSKDGRVQSRERGKYREVEQQEV